MYHKYIRFREDYVFMNIRINNLSKEYAKGVFALKNIDLELENGVIGLLGQNGAGKSTLMRILSTIMKPSSGSVSVDDVDILKNEDYLKHILGYLPQNFGIYPNLSAREFLEYIAAVKGMSKKAANKRINELLELLNLHDVADSPLKSYSGGMKQRVGIAQSLLNDPKFLILDEPTVGLDPEERANIRNIISEISNNRIILYSTHIVTDIESIADKIAIMKKGSLKCYDSIENLINSVRGMVWKETIPYSELNTFRMKYVVSSINRIGDNVEVRVISDNMPMKYAVKVEPRLEDAYMYYCHFKDRGDM